MTTRTANPINWPLSVGRALIVMGTILLIPGIGMLVVFVRPLYTVNYTTTIGLFAGVGFFIIGLGIISAGAYLRQYGRGLPATRPKIIGRNVARDMSMLAFGIVITSCCGIYIGVYQATGPLVISLGLLGLMTVLTLISLRR